MDCRPPCVSTVLVLVTVLIHYEVLRVASDLPPRLTLPPRQRIIVVIIAAFLAHTIEVWLYAIVYYLLTDHLGIGTFRSAACASWRASRRWLAS